jgi:hypothetical protein
VEDCVSCCHVNVRFLDSCYLEKHIKKLMGNTEITDSLERLDKLTLEEARIASTELLKVAHSVEGKVQGFDDKLDHANRSLIL